MLNLACFADVVGDGGGGYAFILKPFATACLCAENLFTLTNKRGPGAVRAHKM
jgi:hypothetical protein